MVRTDEAELAVDAHAWLGEGPSWDEREGAVLWMDILQGAIHRYDPSSGEDRRFGLGQMVCTAVPRDSGGYALLVERGYAALDRLGGEVEMLATVVEQEGVRMNDGKCDASGRFYAGTMAYAETAGAAHFYRLDPDSSLHTLFGGVTISNGIGWSPDGRSMYYIDTPTGRVDVFDYDGATGAIGNRRPCIEIPAEQGSPDGMTTDEEGYLWVALWGGWGVHRYAPDGTLDRVVKVPVRNVSSCVFGGSGHQDLFITTASVSTQQAVLARHPHSGGVFVYHAGVRGMPTNAYRG